MYENFTFNLVLVILLVILQGVLWSWIGMSARNLFSWWPFLRKEEWQHSSDKK